MDTEGGWFLGLLKDIWDHHILPRLGLGDLVRFAAVHHSCRSMAAEHYHNFQRLPWLLISRDIDSHVGTFFDLFDHKTYTVNLSVFASDSYCIASSEGNLVMANRDHNFLYDPFSKLHVFLPQQYVPPQDKHYVGERSDFRYYFDRATVFQPPGQTSRCIIAALGCSKHVLQMCRPGDKEWSVFGTKKVKVEEVIKWLPYNDGSEEYLADHVTLDEPEEDKIFSDILVYRGMLYCLNLLDGLVCFELENALEPFTYKKLDVLHIHTPPTSIDDSNRLSKYLVESCGELLMVYRYRIFFSDMQQKKKYFTTTKFLVYKLDQSCNPLKWVEIKDLDDQILFLGRNSSTSLSRKSSPQIKGNCIYFTDVGYTLRLAKPGIRYSSSRDNGVFYLEDGRIESFFPSDCSYAFESQPIWITPGNVFGSP